MKQGYNCNIPKVSTASLLMMVQVISGGASRSLMGVSLTQEVTSRNMKYTFIFAMKFSILILVL